MFSSSKRVLHLGARKTGKGADVPSVLPQSQILRVANLEIRPGEFQVLIADRRADLTIREFELFFVLAENVDSVLHRPQIYSQIWGGTMPRRDRSVDVLVRKTRRKLELVAPDWRYIHTHFGIGYRFSPEQLP